MVTRTAPSVSSQNASTAASSASAAPRRRAAESPQERARLRGVSPLSEQEDDAPRLAGREVHDRPAMPRRGRGRRRTGSRAAGGRARRRAASEPLRPRNSRRSPVAETSGSLAAANATRSRLVAVQVARQDRAGLAVLLGRHEPRATARSAGRAAIRCRRKALRRRGRSERFVNVSRDSFTGIVPGHEDRELLLDAARDAGEPRHARRVAHHPARRAPRAFEGRWASRPKRRRSPRRG